MECRSVQSLLDAYVDRALPTDEAERVEEHLRTCTACQQELADLQDVLCALNDPELQAMVLDAPAPLPADFTGRVMERIQNERPTSVTLIWPWLRQKWSARQWASAAYAAAATLLVFSAGRALFLWTETTDRLLVWMAQGQAYWEATLAYLSGPGAYMLSLWEWYTSLFQTF